MGQIFPMLRSKVIEQMALGQLEEHVVVTFLQIEVVQKLANM